MKKEQIELRLSICEDGIPSIVDQHGRTIRGLKTVGYGMSIDGANMIELEVMEYIDGELQSAFTECGVIGRLVKK